jgi:GH24 family phage-related lysozyme (muramidase)
MTNSKPISLEKLFRYYKGLPHQTASIALLEEDLEANGYKAVMRRDRDWFKTWSQSGKQSDHKQALALIQKFEGWHADAYLCPAGFWTIGWGNLSHTDGRPVKEGDWIRRKEGDALLENTIDKIDEKLSLTVPYWSEMAENQQAALISFAYNLGSAFYDSQGFETISQKLRTKDWKAVPDAMLLYRNQGSSFEAGLKRRRQAEGNLWKGGDQSPPTETAKLRPGSSFASRLTPHVTLGEFALNLEERRFNEQYQLDTAATLAAFLERVRVRFGSKPVIITSGYRPPAINRSVGGASGSEHLYPAPGVGAVDFYVQGADIYAVQEYCDQNWPHSLGYGANKGFVHLGIREGGPKIRWDY